MALCNYIPQVMLKNGSICYCYLVFGVSITNIEIFRKITKIKECKGISRNGSKMKEFTGISFQINL